MIERHFREVSQIIKDDEELKELEHFIATKNGRITRVGDEQEGTRVFYTLPTIKGE